MTDPIDGTSLLAPGIRETLSTFSLPDVTDEGVLAVLREGAMGGYQPLGTTEGVERSDHLVPGDHDLPVRVHRPKGADGLLPCVVALHGGGLIMGSHTMDDSTFEVWCQELGVMGVSIDYRLAPEHPYPAPLDDCERGLRWTVEHADELGVDLSRLGVRGISAGAGLAAGLALRLRDAGGPALAFQMLETPMLDDRQITVSSTTEGLHVWSRASNQFGWRSFLGSLYGGDVPAEAAPARAVDLSGLPPTFVSVGAADGFRDEAIDYAQRLAQAGVPADLRVYAGLPHGFQAFVHLEAVQDAARDPREWLRRAVA